MLWIAGVCALCMLVCLPLFMHYKHHALRYKLAAAFKTCGTLCAAVLALTAALRLDPRCWICFAALMLHAVADYILEFNLWGGAGFFLAGALQGFDTQRALYFASAAAAIAITRSGASASIPDRDEVLEKIYREN